MERPASSYARDLSLTEHKGSATCAAVAKRGQHVAGMFYSPDKSFGTIYSPERAESLSTLFGSTDVHAWIDRLTPPAADVPLRADGDGQATPYGTAWLPAQAARLYRLRPVV
ncbi:hypothetical protein WK68_21005 [Burkholderia ubonensis]|nr:hypothetical protein WK68_21005 [Burkholderia ubonensis]